MLLSSCQYISLCHLDAMAFWWLELVCFIFMGLSQKAFTIRTLFERIFYIFLYLFEFFLCNVQSFLYSTVPPLFFGGTVPISRQPTISGYQNITFDSTILTLCSTNITYNCTFVTFSDFLIFFLTFDGIILTLCSTNIICDCTFITFSGSYERPRPRPVLWCWAKPTWMGGVMLLPLKMKVLLVIFSPLD